ncbi:MAG: hypothetical protein JRJ65_14865 [Deltaproteobacteria bacterium]|nr:hypothetical protein [Deltaproteobacteria bacterium]
MWFRKPILRMIAPVLAISLVIAGVVPAKTDCKGACGCCEESDNRVNTGIVLFKGVELDHQLHGGFIGVSHNSLRPLLGIFLPSQQPCHKAIETASCQMSQSRSPDLVQGSGPKVPRAERPLPGTFVSFDAALEPGNRAFIGPAVGRLPSARATPVPIYILTLTFLC